MAKPSDCKPGIRGQSLLKNGEDIAEFPDHLPPEDLLDHALTKAGFTGTFAADWFEKKKPQAYRAICFALAKGYPARDIAYILKCSIGTISAIAERECNNLPPAKEAILAKLKVGTRLAAERVMELIPELNGHDAVIALGILTDKMLLLSGEANVIVANQRETPTHQDFNQMINALPQADAKLVNDLNNQPHLDNQHRLDNQASSRAEMHDVCPIVSQTPAKLTISQTNPDKTASNQ
jgi:hypothetical protein